MCTVTYIPPSDEQGFILTSNRDEKVIRETKAPDIYQINGINVCFPKDLEKGGSWIAVGNNGRLVCLLNGAFIPHQKQAFHTHSRGQVLLAIATFNGDLKDFFENEDLNTTEPFTIISIEHKKEKVTSMLEFIWDGAQKHIAILNPEKPGIWSSVTLYSNNDRELRRIWFEDFLNKNNEVIQAEDVYSFHSGEHTNDQTVNLLMEREGGLKTVSITQVVPIENGFSMKYTDLLKQTDHQIKNEQR